ncbi:thiamine pyrophosphate-binding protein [Pseudonocardia sp. C8]|uniref:thiamine pyrophosphate-dependent enzyme n=1 Tax=Pseudonocardia sp. C8 TaxID=2762759 RepID=UPI0016434364|nr:thiamine pyrophosphate-binding protein [Pseudonocardia sp. C8]
MSSPEPHRSSRPGGHALVEQLVAHGVTRAYGVPGESYLAVLDGMHEHGDRLSFVATRQEGGAALMAAAHGRLTGRPGICMVTRGPGATNAAIGVHVAAQDASPMLLLVGQVPRRERGRRAFQEIDYSVMFGGIAKAVVEINEPARVPELTSRALTLATSGEPGPVVVVLPEDVVSGPTSAPVRPVSAVADAAPRGEDVRLTVELLESARAPVVVTGRCGWDADTTAAVRDFAERSAVPLVTGLRNQDTVDPASPMFAGTLGLNTTAGLPERLGAADLVILLGSRPDGLTAQALEPALHGARVVHVYPGADDLGVSVAADVAVACSPAAFVAALPERIEPCDERRRWADSLRSAFHEAHDTVHARDPAAAFMRVFDEQVGSDAIVSCGAGNYTAWPQRFHRFGVYPSQLASTSGAMGYGIPAAIAAAFEQPHREVVAFAGDGCFLMTGQELATITQYQLNVLVIVVNNGRYGTIRDHQERVYPGRVSGTDLTNPEFVPLAEAFGGLAAQVRTPEELAVALTKLRQADGLRLIEIRTDNLPK